MKLDRLTLLVAAREYYRAKRDDHRLAKTTRNQAATLLSRIEAELSCCAVEPRYVLPIVDGIEAEGFTIA